MLFGDEPTMTLERAKEARQKGFQAAKFGWGTIGTGAASEDREHFQAAREGFGTRRYSPRGYWANFWG